MTQKIGNRTMAIGKKLSSCPSPITHRPSRSFASRATVALLFVLAGTIAHAQEKGCISLKTEAQKEQDYTDANGKPAKRLVSPDKIIPGSEVIWTITATNSCNKPAEKVVVNNNVPEHMTYVADSAMGPGAEITFSIDGRDFKKMSELVVRENGNTRPARAEDIKSIRWVIGTPIAPNQMAFVRYRAKVQ